MGISSRLSDDSLSGGLLRRLLIPTIILMLVGYVALSLLIADQMRRVFDDALKSQLQSIAANIEWEEDELEVDLPVGIMANYEVGENPEYFQIWDSGGDSIAQSPSIDSQSLTPLPTRGNKPAFDSVRLPNGKAGRLITARFVPQIDRSDSETASENFSASVDNTLSPSRPSFIVLAVATSNQPFLDLIWHIRAILGGVFFSLIVALVVTMHRSLKRGLSPLTDIQNKIMALRSDDIDQRITPERSVAELQGIVDQTNALLDRMEASLTRERQFSADIAHELRTPLAELRNLAEVGSRWPSDTEMVKRFFVDAIASTAQMELTLANLLTLARTHSEPLTIERAPFDLSKLINQVCLRYHVSTDDAQTRIMINVPDKYQINCARSFWQLIVQNLINNAVSHGVRGGRISVALIPQDSLSTGDVLRFENQTNELQPNDLDKIFDRLWRKETARSGEEHAGLGLSLVKLHTDQLRLKIVASLDAKGCFRMELSGFHRDYDASDLEQGT